MKLSVRLPLATITLVLLPVLVVFYFGYTFIHDELHKNIESKLTAIAKIRSQQIQEYIFAYETRLQSIGDETTLVTMLQQKQDKYSLGKLSNHLKYISSAMPNITRIIAFDAHGHYLTSTDGIKNDISKMALVHLTKDDPNYVYTYIYKKPDKTPKIGMIKAIWRDDEKIGYIGYVFGYEWLNSIGADYTGLGDSGELIVAGWGEDKKAYFLVHRRHIKTGSNESVTVDFNKTKLAIANALLGRQGFSHEYIDYRGVPVVAVTEFISRYGIGIASKMDVTEAHKELEHIFSLSLAVFVMALAILVTLVWFVLHRLGNRIDSYAQVAKKIANGDMSTRIDDQKQDEIGQLGGALNMMMDRLVNINSKLESMVQERTKELKASNSDLQQFAYTASHDLQEPLRMISSYLQLIEKRYKELLGDDGKEFIGYAVDGAKRMQALINGLLEFSRVNTRGGEFLPLDMNSVINIVKHDLSLLIEEAQATVTSDDLPSIVADENQIQELLRNLVSNAIKYKSKENPVVHIGYIKDSSCWHFFVKDNGIGIKEEYFEKIFLIFQRLHDRQTYSGTGIGLSICKRIADRHDGELWVESAVGVGSTFHFTISKKL